MHELERTNVVYGVEGIFIQKVWRKGKRTRRSMRGESSTIICARSDNGNNKAMRKKPNIAAQ